MLPKRADQPFQRTNDAPGQRYPRRPSLPPHSAPFAPQAEMDPPVDAPSSAPGACSPRPGFPSRRRRRLSRTPATEIDSAILYDISKTDLLSSNDHSSTCTYGTCVHLPVPVDTTVQKVNNFTINNDDDDASRSGRGTAHGITE